jgi:hypothetical protein
MALQGTLREFSATEILQLLATQRKTGCLVLENESQRSQVYVLDGRIVSTRADVPLDQDRLYHFLRRVRRLSEEQLRGIIALNAESRRDIEDLIVRGRYLEAEELAVLIERQILDDLTTVIEWTEGRYGFEPDNRWRHPVIVRLSIEASLIEAARRGDERKRFQDLFKDGRQVVSVRDLPDPDQEISDEESELFGMIDGQHTVAEIVAGAPLSDYEASEALYRMVDAGWVEFLGDRSQVPHAPPAVKPSVSGQQPLLSNPLPTARSWVREAAVTLVGAVWLAALWVGAQALHPAGRERADDPVFAAAQIRDVKLALQLYHRERGQYPSKLEDLVEDHWLDRSQITVAGQPLHYHPEFTIDRYQLDKPTSQ